MKRFLSILLALVLLIPTAVSLADGTETTKAITFSNFTFGDTFDSIRATQYCRSIEFYKGNYNARWLADSYSNMANWGHDDETKPWCFSARFSNVDKVAGYEAVAELWFVYPAGSADAYSEGDAVFYAGQYNFYNGDQKAIFDDLKNKLTQVYGEAYYIGDDLSAALGEPQMNEDYINAYNEEINRMAPEYAVWKSSENNAAAVLMYYQQNGNEPFTRLMYISMEGEEYFAAMQEATASGTGENSDSLAGL